MSFSKFIVSNPKIFAEISGYLNEKEIYDLTTREIRLSTCEIVLCSACDYNELKKHTWGKSRDYASNKIFGFMHRFIVEKLMNCKIPDGMFVDHINRKPLDNRRENLRIATPQQNAYNRSKKTGATSEYFGVSWNKKDGKWRVSISVDGNPIKLGSFNNELDAAKMYDLYLSHRKKENPNEIRDLNFPKDYEEYLKQELIIPKPRKPKSGFKGVVVKERGYRAQIYVKGIRKCISYSTSARKCAKAYDKYVVEHEMDNKLNFPEDYPNYKPKRKIKTSMIKNDDQSIKLHIKSSPNSIVLIDKEDYELVKYHCCHILNGTVNIRIENKNKRLNRLVMNENDPKIIIDHKNGNPFDNRKENLRRTDYQGNAENKQKKKGTSSDTIGVSKRKNKKSISWKVEVMRERKVVFRKTYKTEEYAARARDLYIIINLPNTLYKMNFKWNEEDIKKWKKILDM
jgi:hypothetical protein